MIIAIIIHVSMQCHSICSAMHSPLPETFLFLNQGFMARYNNLSLDHGANQLAAAASPTLYLLCRENQPHPFIMQREPAPPSTCYAERTSPTLLLCRENQPHPFIIRRELCTTLSVQLARLSNVKTSWKGSSYKPNELPLDPPLCGVRTHS